MVFRQRPNMPSYLTTYLLLQLPFRLLNELSTLMLLSLAILTKIRVMSKAKVAKVNSILMTSSGTLHSDVYVALLDFM